MASLMGFSIVQTTGGVYKKAHRMKSLSIAKART